jgi:hypothetical protein
VKPNLKIRVSPEYNFKRVQNTLECCADYLEGQELGGDAWLLDDVRDALARIPALAAAAREGQDRNGLGAPARQSGGAAATPNPRSDQ